MQFDNMNPISLYQNIQDYNEYFDEVIEWNGVVLVEPKELSAQWTLVEEEAQELFEAYDKGDIKEFFKELCDLFFVSSYAAFIEDNHVKAFVSCQDSIEYLLSVLEDSVYSKDVARTFLITLELMNSVNQNALNNTMNAVMRSNWSKIFPEHDAAEELAVANVAYASRYEGIYVQSKPSGCVLKDKSGKVIKPSSYLPYTEYLGQ